ncbi:MAG: TIGR03936 family radical SAM-associated protein [Clostridiaceae bacterium]|nr:TIGR03936 family radical SAM-associated protein [Clostridiaceae bacterium]
MKARLKFSKTGSMRFIGHLDVMRYFQKAFRRAGIQVSYSQGYSPHQLLSFASPLGIGLSSTGEYLDIVLEDTEDCTEIIERINAVMNDEIRAEAFSLLEEDAKTSMAVLAACDYLVAVKPGKQSFLLDGEKRAAALKRFAEREKVELLKKTKRSEKLVDIRENIYCMTDQKRVFEQFSGLSVPEKNIVQEGSLPVLYLELTAGSVVNIKPELVLEALYIQEGENFDAFACQIHRLEMYGDLQGKKGEVHTMTSEIPCQLVPLSDYQAKTRINSSDTYKDKWQ